MTRLLVVLPNWFGETLFATPFLEALRAAHPAARITAFGRPQCRQVLLHHPAIDDILVFDERGAHRGPAGWLRAVRELRANRFDTAYILRRSVSRTALLALAGIAARIGFDNPKSGWLLTQRVDPPPEPRHKAIGYLSLLDEHAPADAACRYTYAISPQEADAAGALLREAGIADGEPFLVMHPGANWYHKRWPTDRFAALADRLAARTNARIVISGSPEDAPLVDELAGHMQTAPIRLAGRTTLRQLAACLARARLLVAADTGVMHIASAIGTPVLALYGPTSPVITGPLGRPDHTTVLHHATCCPQVPCYAPETPAHPGMGSISVGEAFEAACDLWNRSEAYVPG
jgi:lipopolysaccharide heptosyltransferase II